MVSIFLRIWGLFTAEYLEITVLSQKARNNNPLPTLAKHKADIKGNQVIDNVQKRHKATGPYKMMETIPGIMNNG